MGWNNSIFPLLIVTSGGGFTGLFEYSPAPGSGNLVASVAAAPGTDPFGNAYLAGVTTYTTVAPFVAVRTWQSVIAFFTASSQAGPWTISAAEGLYEAAITSMGLISVSPGGFNIGGAAGTFWLPPSGDVTGINDTANINAIFALGSATVQLLPGTYYTNSTINKTSGQYLRGSGKWSTIINWKGTGDCIRAVDASTYSTRTVQGGGVTDLLIDGTSAGAGSNGLHAGDIFQYEVDVAVRNFTGAGSAGVLFDNQNFFTEQLHGRVYVLNCTNGVLFNCGGALTSTGSFDRMTLDIFLGMASGQNGVGFQNGAFAFGRLGIYGNMNVGSAANSVLFLTGSTPAGHPSSFSTLGNTSLGVIELYIDVELDGVGTAPSTIFFGGGSNALVGHGSMNFQNGGTAFASSNNAGQVQFQGPVSGDATLRTLNWRGSTAQVITANGQMFSAGLGSVLRTTGASAFTGLIVAAGIYDGQELLIVNQGTNALTMDVAGTSHVANGVACIVQGNSAVYLVWDAAVSLWFQVRQ